MRLILRLVGIAAILGMTLYLLWRDERPPADADLRNYRRDVKDEENGFRLLDLTQDDIVWPEDYDDVLGGSAKFDREKASEIARSNASLLDKVDLALAMPDFQVDVLEHVEEPTPHILAWRYLAHALDSRSRLRIEEGKPDAAYEDALRLIRLGGRIQRAQGTLLECLQGIAVQAFGNHRLVHMAVHGELPVGILRRGIDELAPEVRRNGIADALRAEYHMISNTNDLYASGKTIRNYAPGPALFLKPNQTRRLLAEKIRALIESDAELPSSRKPFDLSDLSPRTAEVFLLRSAGKKSLNVVLSSWGPFLLGSDMAAVRLAATRTLLGLLAYRAEKGGLPDSIQELVPDYLGAIPIDPYTGKEFRYSREKMLVYSTQADGFDAGGSVQEDGWEALWDFVQPTLRLDPAAWKLYEPVEDEPSEDGSEE